MRVSIVHAVVADLGRDEVVAVTCGFCGRRRQISTRELLKRMQASDRILSIKYRARCIRCGARTGNASISIVPSRG